MEEADLPRRRFWAFAVDALEACRPHPVAKYAAAATIALLALVLRNAFGPVLNPGATYFLYYPIVVAVAYFLGLGTSLLALAICGVGSYFLFSLPAFEIKTDLRTNARLVLFLGSGALLAAAAAHVRARLERLEGKVAGAMDLTRTQAEIFRDHAERVAGHLQLLSALLQLRASNEPEADYARVIMNASSRTLLVSRLHRSFASTSERRFAFSEFAQKLADAALEAHGKPPLVIALEGELSLYPEQATSLALILLECIYARAGQGKPGLIRVSLTQDANEGTLTLTEETPPERALPNTALIQALAEQMRGRLLFGHTKARGVVRFAFPIDEQPLPAWNPLEPLH